MTDDGSFFSPTPCPCGSGAKAATCCSPYLRGGDAPTAEALMRSRYCAYVVEDVDYLLRSWHPATRPTDLVLGDQEWLELRVESAVGGAPGDDEGEVEFRATFLDGDGVRRVLWERSSFARYDGRWVYVGAADATLD